MSDRTYRKKDTIVTRKVAGEIILVPVCGELASMQRIFSVDSVAAFIWESLDGSRSEKVILEGIKAVFDVDDDTAAKDLREFINELNTAGLIDEVADGL